MRYRVDGVKSATGEDVSIVIEAADSGAAEAGARAQGIYVSSARPAPAPPISYATPLAPKADPSSGGDFPLSRAEVEREADTLLRRASVVSGVAILCIVIGVAIAVLGVLDSRYEAMRRAQQRLVRGDEPMRELLEDLLQHQHDVARNALVVFLLAFGFACMVCSWLMRARSVEIVARPRR